MCSVAKYHWVVIIRLHIYIFLGSLTYGYSGVQWEVSLSFKMVKLSLLLSSMGPNFLSESAYSVCL